MTTMDIVNDFWEDDTEHEPAQMPRLMYTISPNSERIHAQNQLKQLSGQFKQTTDPLEQAWLWNKMAALQWAVDTQPVAFQSPKSKQKLRPMMTKKQMKQARRLLKDIRKLCKQYDMSLVDCEDYGMFAQPNEWLEKFDSSERHGEGLIIYSITP